MVCLRLVPSSGMLKACTMHPEVCFTSMGSTVALLTVNTCKNVGSICQVLAYFVGSVIRSLVCVLFSVG